MSALSDLLSEVVAVTRPPRGMDPKSVEASVLRYMRIMRDYPEDVSFKALDDWPKTHEFFPTEPELRGALDSAHRILRPHNKLPPYDDGMLEYPSGATKAFLDELRKINPSKAATYFSHGDARFSDCRIGVKCMFVQAIMERYAPGLLAKHGVRIVEPHRYVTSDDGSIGVQWRW